MAPPTNSLTGQVIDGKYRITGLIGRGGMGEVYEGENVRIRRRVAIKVLHAAAAASAEVVSRFEREAQAAGCIGSDHIMEVLDLGSLPSGDRYMVMEFLDGETLTARITRHGRMTAAQLAPLVRQVLTGLGAAHEAGIVHRDLKPDNLFILRQKAGNADFVKIIDFGISKFSRAGDALNMTRAGAMMGTPLYMSPEQANGSSEADQRSDIYSLGLIMYEALTGVLPFNAKTFNELLFQIVLAEVKPLLSTSPDVDPEFANIVHKAMARNPVDRFQNAREFNSALEGWMARNNVHAMGGQILKQSVPPTAGPQPKETQVNWQQQGGPVAPNTPMPGAQNGSNPSFQQSSTAGLVQSQSGTLPTKSSKAPIVVAAIFALVVFGGGGTLLAMRIFGGDPPKSSTAAAADESKGTKSESTDKKSEDEADEAPEKSTDEAPEKKAKSSEEAEHPAEEAASASAQPSAAPTVAPTVATNAPTAKPTASSLAATPKGTVTAKPTASSKTPPKGGGETDFGY